MDLEKRVCVQTASKPFHRKDTQQRKEEQEARMLLLTHNSHPSRFPV
jgi:hypothetical protein